MYTPPFPARPTKKGATLKVLWAARKNLIALWPADTFSLNNFSYKLFRRHIHFITIPETVKAVFVDGAAMFEPKTHQLKNALRPLIGNGLFISDGDTWRTRRRIVAPITHVSRLPELTPAITACAAVLRTRWRDQPRHEVDILADMSELAVGIIVRCVFGRDLDPAISRRLVAEFRTYRALSDQTDVLSLLGVSAFLPRPKGIRSLIAARRIHRILDPLIADLLAPSNLDESPLLDAMIAGGLAGGSRSSSQSSSKSLRRALREEAAVMILAGQEGTANTLAWAFFILSQDSETERRLHEEVDTVLGEEPAVFGDFANLPFTRAVIEETLRLYPPIPFQGRIATSDGAIGEQAIRKGDLVILNAWIMHRHTKLWPDPDAFLPDRFLPPDGGAPSRYAYVPFSIGPRVCTGAAFGLLESVLCLATLARQVRLRLRTDFVVEPGCRLSLRPGEYLPMTIEVRDHARQH